MDAPLVHVSEEAGIERFEPRPVGENAYGLDGTAVWAITERLLPNYLLPRDCPRVTFYAQPDSDPADVAQLLGESRHVVAFESRWLPAVQNGRLFCYTLPPDTFTLLDAGAGYYISRQTVMPLAVYPIDDLLLALAGHDVEIRIMPSLWSLYEAVVNSSLQYSIIRMRNAAPK